MTMDLLALRYFREVARREHISDAAAHLGVAQPSVSRTVARLESDLGVPLFDRKGRQVRLNRHGRAYLRRVERALDELDDGRREMSDAARTAAGTLSIASETLLTVAGVLAGYRRDHSGVEIRLRQATPVEMARLLREREVDVCLASQPLPGPAVETLRLVEEEVLLAVPSEHRLAGRTAVAIADLADDPFVSTAAGHWMRGLLDRLFAEAGLEPRITCVGDEPAALLQLVRAGIGVGLFPEMGRVASTDTDLAWVPLRGGARRALDLAWRSDVHMSAATVRFCETAARHFGAATAGAGRRR